MEPMLSMLASLTSGINWDTVALYYGKICFYCTPLSLLCLIYMSIKKYTIADMLKKGFSKDKVTKTDKAEITQKEENPPSVEEQNEIEGIPNMIVKVGDKYACRLSRYEESICTAGTNRTWALENRFLGDIGDRTGKFTARKVGKTYIVCGEQRKKIYYVNIQPTDERWFAKRILEQIFEATDIANAKMFHTKEKNRITVLEEGKSLFGVELKEGKLLYSYNKRKRINRILFSLENTDKNRTSLLKHLDEYMTDAETTNAANAKYFYHMVGEDSSMPDSIDYIAIVKQSSVDTSRLLFGIAECWRPGAQPYEIKSNPEMIERSFAGLMDDRDIPVSLADKEVPEQEEKKEPAKAETDVPDESTKTDDMPGKETQETPEEASPAKTEEKETQESVPEQKEDEIPDVSEEREAASMNTNTINVGDGQTGEPENYDEENPIADNMDDMNGDYSEGENGDDAEDSKREPDMNEPE